jgi:hypothetical protein
MAWITPTETDLGARLASAELAALQTAAVGDYGNTVPDVLASVVAEVRGRVAANPANSLGDAGTIPEELKAAALAIARWRILTRLPGMRSLQDEARRAEYNDAQALLTAVARGEFAIEQPDDPIEADIGGVPDPDVGDERTDFARDQFDGT